MWDKFKSWKYNLLFTNIVFYSLTVSIFILAKFSNWRIKNSPDKKWKITFYDLTYSIALGILLMIFGVSIGHMERDGSVIKFIGELSSLPYWLMILVGNMLNTSHRSKVRREYYNMTEEEKKRAEREDKIDNLIKPWYKL